MTKDGRKGTQETEKSQDRGDGVRGSDRPAGRQWGHRAGKEQEAYGKILPALPLCLKSPLLLAQVGSHFRLPEAIQVIQARG